MVTPGGPGTHLWGKESHRASGLRRRCREHRPLRGFLKRGRRVPLRIGTRSPKALRSVRRRALLDLCRNAVLGSTGRRCFSRSAKASRRDLGNPACCPWRAGRGRPRSLDRTERACRAGVSCCGTLTVPRKVTNRPRTDAERMASSAELNTTETLFPGTELRLIYDLVSSKNL